MKNNKGITLIKLLIIIMIVIFVIFSKLLSAILLYLCFLSLILSPPSSGKIPKLAFIGWNLSFSVDIYLAKAPITVFSEKITFSFFTV